ncbi:hypothetical protein DL96DRAFT_1559333 [Flagelloscypha sp. PMI_526]|nr:hypothetical protein DL96DRAFT_1559333 [Flagelloscypha sp. PMI_526]
MRIRELSPFQPANEHVHPLPSLPPEIWQEVAQFLSLRELENAVFLHPALALAERAKKPITISLPSPDGTPAGSSELIEIELIEARRRHIQSHVRSLRLRFDSATRDKQSFGLKSLFRVLLRSFSHVGQDTNLDFLRDFENITELLLDPGERDFSSFQIPSFWQGSRQPYTLETWRVLGPGLTSLSITLNHDFEGIFSLLPPPGITDDPLPCLERISLDVPLGLPQLPYDFLSQQKKHNMALQVLPRISAFYQGSRTLKELSFNSCDSDPLVFDTELLSILLPSQGQIHYPELTKFGTWLPFYDVPQNWDAALLKFLSTHSTSLKVLRLGAATPSILARWLGINFPNIDRLELDISQQDVGGFWELNQSFPSLVQNCLTVLAIGVFASNEELKYLIGMIGMLAPRLETLRIGPNFRLWPSFFFSLSTQLPKLYSLVIEVSELETDDGKRVLSCDQFLNEAVCDVLRKDALKAWILYDIGFRSDTLTLEQAGVIMKGLAELIPSVRSFFMRGDTLYP